PLLGRNAAAAPGLFSLDAKLPCAAGVRGEAEMRAQVGRHRYFWGAALTISLLHSIAAVAATREWVPIGSGGSVVALVIDPANPNRAFAATPHGGGIPDRRCRGQLGAR